MCVSHGRWLLLQVLSPAYSPGRPAEHRHQATVTALYLMMGRGLESLQVGGQTALHPGSLPSRSNPDACMLSSSSGRPGNTVPRDGNGNFFVPYDHAAKGPGPLNFHCRISIL